MQSLFNALAGLLALIFALGLFAAIALAAIDAIAGRGWFTRIGAGAGSPAALNPEADRAVEAANARADVDHGRRVVDRADWHDATSHSSGSSSDGGD